jgi:hypothetical protein
MLHVNPHIPPVHARVALARMGQALSHAPQSSGLVCVLTQAIPQRDSPVAQPDTQRAVPPMVVQSGVAPEQTVPHPPHDV